MIPFADCRLTAAGAQTQMQVIMNEQEIPKVVRLIGLFIVVSLPIVFRDPVTEIVPLET
jgi:hypothetical protein